VLGYPNNSFKEFPTKEEAEEEYFNSFGEERSNNDYVVRKKKPRSSRVKTYIIIGKFIIIVFLVLLYII
jgi:viroplasmin and RNaseH domain-containing protein